MLMIGYTDGDVVRQDYSSCVYVSVPFGVKNSFSSGEILWYCVVRSFIKIL
jgi:hypothetical protein